MYIHVMFYYGLLLYTCKYTYLYIYDLIYIYIYTSRFTYKDYISIHMYFFSAAVMFLGRGCRIEGVEEQPLDYILVGFRSELALVEHQVEGFRGDWHGAALVARQREIPPFSLFGA